MKRVFGKIPWIGKVRIRLSIEAPHLLAKRVDAYQLDKLRICLFNVLLFFSWHSFFAFSYPHFL